jgi:trimeric autotransporter adhesin
MSTRTLGTFIAVLWLTAWFIVSAEAQVALTGTNYTQNFNTISNSLPPGWSVRTNAKVNSLGLSATFPTAAKSWSDTTGEFGSCAALTNNLGVPATGVESSATQATFTNRVLAVRQTQNFGDPGAAFVLQIANTLGFSNLTFSLDFNLLKPNGYSTTWTMDYAVSNTPASFSPLGTYNDPGSIGTTNRSFTLGTDADNQTNNLWIRITALSASTGSGSRDTFGIDNFSLSWTTGNLAVVMPAITAIVVNGGDVQIDFTGGTSDAPTSFLLLSSAQPGGTYADTGAIITSLGSGLFRGACAVNGPQQFYRIKRP